MMLTDPDLWIKQMYNYLSFPLCMCYLNVDRLI